MKNQTPSPSTPPQNIANIARIGDEKRDVPISIAGPKKETTRVILPVPAKNFLLPDGTCNMHFLPILADESIRDDGTDEEGGISAASTSRITIKRKALSTPLDQERTLPTGIMFSPPEGCGRVPLLLTPADYRALPSNVFLPDFCY